jgi:hypothetical protein
MPLDQQLLRCLKLSVVAVIVEACRLTWAKQRGVVTVAVGKMPSLASVVRSPPAARLVALEAARYIVAAVAQVWVTGGLIEDDGQGRQ